MTELSGRKVTYSYDNLYRLTSETIANDAWRMDTDEGKVDDPASLHKYLYTRGDSVNRIDPSGHDDIAEMMTVAVVVVTLSSMATAPNIASGRVQVEVHFNTVDFPFSPHHSYILLKGSGQPTEFFRGGPAPDNHCGLSDLPGINTEADCGDVTPTYGPFTSNTIDYPGVNNNDDVAEMNIPVIGAQSYSSLLLSFKSTSDIIGGLRVPYTPAGENCNAFSYTLLRNANLMTPTPPVWAPGWGTLLYSGPNAQ